MNKVILMGRLTRDPEVRYSNGENSTAIAKYTLAVDRRLKRDGEPTADFIRCVTFGRNAEFAEKYLRQGTKIVICGRIQTGSYINQDGQTVYTTDVVVEEQDFAESKSNGNNNQQSNQRNQNSQQTGNPPMGSPNQNSQQTGNPPMGMPNKNFQQTGNPPMGMPNQNFQQSGNLPMGSQNYQQSVPNQPTYNNGGFMNIPDGIDEELPFN